MKSLAEIEAIVATTCSVWERGSRETVSIDAQVFLKLFPFLPIIHTVHDQHKTPYLILVNRKDAIRLATEHYGLSSKNNIMEKIDGSLRD